MKSVKENSWQKKMKKEGKRERGKEIASSRQPVCGLWCPWWQCNRRCTHIITLCAPAQALFIHQHYLPTMNSSASAEKALLVLVATDHRPPPPPAHKGNSKRPARRGKQHTIGHFSHSLASSATSTTNTECGRARSPSPSTTQSH